MKIGLIGIGRMGIEMVRHLINGGFKVTVYDVSKGQLEKAAKLGAKTASSPGELAQLTDCCFVAVAAEAQVSSVIEGENGVLQEADPGYITLISSSVGPDLCRRLFDAAAEKGVHVLDAPVVFGQQGAIDGKLKALVGGDESVLKKVKSALLTFCVDVLYMGEVGNGQITKTVNNMLHWTMVVANYEALSLSKRLNIHPARMREAIMQCPSHNGALERWLDHNLTWPRKDMITVRELSDKVDLSIPLHGLVDQLIRQLNKDMTHGLVQEPK